MIIPMSNSRDQLIADIAEAVRDFQDATDEVDEAAAAMLGINRTDLRCLAVLTRCGSLTAGQLASEVGLSSGATTSAIDRLVRQGHVERVRRDRDRRSITVTLTPSAVELKAQIWGPIGQESMGRLRRRNLAQLEAIHGFLEEGIALQVEHAARIRGLAGE